MESQLLKATKDESIEKAAPKTVLQDISTPIPLGSGYFDNESIKKALQRTIQRDYSIQGFNFHIDIVESKIRLSHPKWSLIAEGNNLIQAENKLIAEAKEVSEIYLDIPENQLDENAQEFKDFLFSIRDFG
jgi:hypothetical protein